MAFGEQLVGMVEIKALALSLRSLKTSFSTSISTFSALEVYTIIRCINPHFTYVLTYDSRKLVLCAYCIFIWTCLA